MPMRRYLVTGGAGFIGSHLVDALIQAGHRVRVLDDLSTGKLGNLDNVRRHDRFELVNADVRNVDSVQAATKGQDGIFHLAALVSVQQSIAEPLKSFEINVGGTLNVLEAARLEGVRRVVLASSAAVYGHAPSPAREDETPISPLVPYAFDKYSAECYCNLYSVSYGLETLALRFFNVYGLRQNPASPYSGVISVFSDRLRHREGVTIYGDGKQTRDFVHVSDVVQAMIAAMFSEKTGFNICNIGSGESITIEYLLKTLAGIAGWDPPVNRQPARPGDILHSCADIRRARDLFGYIPRRELGAGLRELLTV
jgi:UDP-glucose 4-epimerase